MANVDKAWKNENINEWGTRDLTDKSKKGMVFIDDTHGDKDYLCADCAKQKFSNGVMRYNTGTAKGKLVPITKKDLPADCWSCSSELKESAPKINVKMSRASKILKMVEDYGSPWDSESGGDEVPNQPEEDKEPENNTEVNSGGPDNGGSPTADAPSEEVDAPSADDEPNVADLDADAPWEDDEDEPKEETSESEDDNKDDETVKEKDLEPEDEDDEDGDGETVSEAIETSYVLKALNDAGIKTESVKTYGGNVNIKLVRANESAKVMSLLQKTGEYKNIMVSAMDNKTVMATVR